MGKKFTSTLYTLAAVVTAAIGAGAANKWSDQRMKSDVSLIEDPVGRLKGLV